MPLSYFKKVHLLLMLSYTVQYFLFSNQILHAEEGVIFENPYQKIEKQTDVNNYSIYFTKKSTIIAKADLTRLQATADFLNQNRNYEVIIEAYAAEGKTNKENITISEKRSLEVERFLLIHYVEQNQIRRLFYGNSKSENLTKEHEALNRRVEIKIQPMN